MKLNFPHTNKSEYGNHSENQDNVASNQIDVDFGIIEDKNQISASKI